MNALNKAMTAQIATVLYGESTKEKGKTSNAFLNQIDWILTSTFNIELMNCYFAQKGDIAKKAISELGLDDAVSKIDYVSELELSDSSIQVPTSASIQENIDNVVLKLVASGKIPLEAMEKYESLRIFNSDYTEYLGLFMADDKFDAAFYAVKQHLQSDAMSRKEQKVMSRVA